MDRTAERRRSRRFERESITACVALIRDGAPDLALEPCTLVNVSYGGMCLRAWRDLRRNRNYRFLLDLQAPFRDLVLVKARVLWIGADRAAGVEFVESSKGWLGPEDDSAN